MHKYCFGVDVGGTTVKIGLFTLEGEVADKWEIPTRKEEQGSHILPDIASSIEGKLSEKKISKEEIKGLGIGVPGPVTGDGTVLTCVNIGWKEEVHVSEIMRGLTGIENVKANNDANVAALGEMWKGGGKGYQDMIMVTLGTGVGGGIIIGGKILSGSKGAAGEIGHITVDFNELDACNCGKRGCLEQFASATGIVKEAKRLLDKTEEETSLRNLKELTAKAIFDAAKENDAVAAGLVDQLGRYLGVVLSHIAEIIDPEAFVIGGGVSKAGDILLDVIRKYYDAHVFQALRGKEFKLATLGNDAGIFGSARMVIDN